MDKEQIIILHAKPYSFVNKETGELLEGIKIDYIMSGGLAPLDLLKGEKGYSIAQSTIPLSKLVNITSVPGVYSPTYTKTVNSKGQVLQKLIDVSFVSVLSGLSNK